MGPGYPARVGLWYTPYWNGDDAPALWASLIIKPPLLGRYVARNPKIIAQHYGMVRDFGKRVYA